MLRLTQVAMYLWFSRLYSNKGSWTPSNSLTVKTTTSTFPLQLCKLALEPIRRGHLRRLECCTYSPNVYPPLQVFKNLDVPWMSFASKTNRRNTFLKRTRILKSRKSVILWLRAKVSTMESLSSGRKWRVMISMLSHSSQSILTF